MWTDIQCCRLDKVRRKPGHQRMISMHRIFLMVEKYETKAPGSRMGPITDRTSRRDKKTFVKCMECIAGTLKDWL